MPIALRLFLILATGGYLAAEIGFNLDLWRALTEDPSPAALQRMADAGRVLATAGFVLTLFKFVTRRWWILLPAAAGFFAAEEMLVERLVERVDGELRRRTVIVETAVRAHLAGNARVAGLPSGTELTNRERATAAVLLPPAAVLSGADLAAFETAAVAELRRRAGLNDTGPAWRKYADGISKLQALYATYNGTARDDREERMEQAWAEYRTHVPGGWFARARAHGAIVKGLQDRGLRVPKDFNLDDKSAFARAFEEKYQREVDAALPAGLPAGLTFENFAAHKQFADKLQGLSPTLDRASFNATLERRFKERLTTMTPDSYMTSEIGRAAAMRLVVPSLGLGLSVIFGTLNLASLIALALPLFRQGDTALADAPIAATMAIAAAGAVALIGHEMIDRLPAAGMVVAEAGVLKYVLWLQAGIGAIG